MPSDVFLNLCVQLDVTATTTSVRHSAVHWGWVLLSFLKRSLRCSQEGWLPELVQINLKTVVPCQGKVEVSHTAPAHVPLHLWLLLISRFILSQTHLIYVKIIQVSSELGSWDNPLTLKKDNAAVFGDVNIETNCDYCIYSWQKLFSLYL